MGATTRVKPQLGPCHKFSRGQGGGNIKGNKSKSLHKHKRSCMARSSGKQFQQNVPPRPPLRGSKGTISGWEEFIHLLHAKCFQQGCQQEHGLLSQGFWSLVAILFFLQSVESQASSPKEEGELSDEDLGQSTTLYDGISVWVFKASRTVRLTGGNRK